MPKKTEDKKKYCFKILMGLHGEGGKLYANKKAQKDIQDHDGDIIHTDSDLATKFNSRGVTKFIPFDAEDFVNDKVEPDAEGNVDFQGMTVSELKKFADDNEIDLGPATSKADILEAVLTAWGDD